MIYNSFNRHQALTLDMQSARFYIEQQLNSLSQIEVEIANQEAQHVSLLNSRLIGEAFKNLLYECKIFITTNTASHPSDLNIVKMKYQRIIDQLRERKMVTSFLANIFDLNFQYTPRLEQIEKQYLQCSLVSGNPTDFSNNYLQMKQIKKLMFKKEDIYLPPSQLIQNSQFKERNLCKFANQRIVYHEELPLRFFIEQKIERYLKILSQRSPFSNKEMINLWMWVKNKFPQESITFWINKKTKKLFISTSAKISTCLIYFVLQMFQTDAQFCNVDDQQLTKIFFDLDSQEEGQQNKYEMQKFANIDEFLLYLKIQEISSTDLGYGLNELIKFLQEIRYSLEKSLMFIKKEKLEKLKELIKIVYQKYHFDKFTTQKSSPVMKKFFSHIFADVLKENKGIEEYIFGQEHPIAKGLNPCHFQRKRTDKIFIRQIENSIQKNFQLDKSRFLTKQFRSNTWQSIIGSTMNYLQENNRIISSTERVWRNIQLFKLLLPKNECFSCIQFFYSNRIISLNAKNVKNIIFIGQIINILDENMINPIKNILTKALREDKEAILFNCVQNQNELLAKGIELSEQEIVLVSDTMKKIVQDLGLKEIKIELVSILTRPVCIDLPKDWLISLLTSNEIHKKWIIRIKINVKESHLLRQNSREDEGSSSQMWYISPENKTSNHVCDEFLGRVETLTMNNLNGQQ